jgi:hypothetical protein
MRHCAKPPGPFHRAASITRRPGSLGRSFFALSAFNFITSTDRSDDTTRWNTGQLTLAAEHCGDRITLCPGRAANDVACVLTRLACGRLPGSGIGHWTFEREDASILVDDDQEERLRRFVFVHGLKESVPCYRLHAFITLGRHFPQRRVRCQP